MDRKIKVEILPEGRILEVESRTSLQEVLFQEGVEFPCGGKGICKTCRIKVIEGIWEPNAIEKKAIGKKGLEEGWRLACQGIAQTDLKIELQKVKDEILGDNRRVHFKPQEGIGVAVDLGTTTVVAQLIDLETGALLSTVNELNQQAQFGADIMSRITFALTPANKLTVQKVITDQIWKMIKSLIAETKRNFKQLQRVVIAGNTVMHHLFCGLSVESLAFYPFETSTVDLQIFEPAQLGWIGDGKFKIYFLPCIGSFVGSDILCGILSTALYKDTSLSLLVDLGTNGEIVLGNCNKILCTSTAAGPAFEGARISMGMRATTGAISRVWVNQDELNYKVIGNVPAKGICGSGLVDATAVGLKLGWINRMGRIVNRSQLQLKDSVVITQNDIRELQLAKGAISAGIRMLLALWKSEVNEVKATYLSGAFGNYISIESAKIIGLLPYELTNVLPAGNTSLHGAKIVLCNFSEDEMRFNSLKKIITSIQLKSLSEFEDLFIEQLIFPNRKSD